jgi:hypothetical protein
MKDASTGAILWRHNGTGDTGRGLIADVCPITPGAESWATNSAPGLFSARGVRLSQTTPGFTTNMAIFWDGDTGRELFDGGNNYFGATGANARITKITRSSSGTYNGSTIKDFGSDVSTWSTTKQNPLLQGDILGDWREEVILRAKDNSHIRIYTTTMPTVHTGPGRVPNYGIPTLMDDHQYRMAIVWQNAGYNQPPHTSWFIGFDMDEIRAPRVNVTGMTLNKNTLDLVESFTEQLIAGFSPVNASDRTVEWTSSNTAVATVLNGLVTARTPGVTTITARSRDGDFVDQCIVTVKPFETVTLFDWNAETDPAFAAIPVAGTRTINGRTVYNFFRDGNNALDNRAGPIAIVQAGGRLRGAQSSDIEWTIQKPGYVLVENVSPCFQIGSSAAVRTTATTAPNGQFDLQKPIRITATYTGVSLGSNNSGILIGILNNTGNISTSPLGANSSEDIPLVIDGNIKTYERIFNPSALGLNESQMNMLANGFITVRCVRAAGWLVLHSIKIEQMP